MRTRQAGASHARGSTAGTILYLLLGPIIWAAHMTAIYFSQSMLCAHGLANSSVAGIDVVPGIVAAATIAALAILFAAILLPGSTARIARAAGSPIAERTFHRRIMAALAILSAVGVAWAGLAVIFVQDCPPLR